MLLTRGCVIEENTLVGEGTQIGRESAATTVIKNCIIGKDCVIGAGVYMDNVYLFDNVVIEDGCRLDKCILGSNVKIHESVNIGKRCVLGHNTIVGADAILPDDTVIADLDGADDDDFTDSEDSGSDRDVGESDEILGEGGRGKVVEVPDGDDDDDDNMVRYGWGTLGHGALCSRAEDGVSAGVRPVWPKGDRCVVKMCQCVSTFCLSFSCVSAGTLRHVAHHMYLFMLREKRTGQALVVRLSFCLRGTVHLSTRHRHAGCCVLQLSFGVSEISACVCVCVRLAAGGTVGDAYLDKTAGGDEDAVDPYMTDCSSGSESDSDPEPADPFEGFLEAMIDLIGERVTSGNVDHAPLDELRLETRSNRAGA